MVVSLGGVLVLCVVCITVCLISIAMDLFAIRKQLQKFFLHR